MRRNFFNKTIPKNCILILVILFGAESFARNYTRNPITEISISSDPIFVPEFDSLLSIGLTIKYENGKIRKTRGLNKGTKSWNKFDIKVSHGYFKNGSVFFNRKEVLKS
ncbi:MAG: hypothetical protein RID18_10150, partial [Cytophagales bacterium]